jgi:hypothetical protein
MKGLARHTFAICLAISLLLVLTVVVFWARSYWVIDGFGRGQFGDKGSWRVSSVRGVIKVSLFRQMSQSENRASSNWHQNRVFFSTGDLAPSSPTQPVSGIFVRERWAAIPYWLPVAILGLTTALMISAVWRRYRSMRWVAHQRCVNCGYDLRATPDRCPECGTGTSLAKVLA